MSITYTNEWRSIVPTLVSSFAIPVEANINIDDIIVVKIEIQRPLKGLITVTDDAGNIYVAISNKVSPDKRRVHVFHAKVLQPMRHVTILFPSPRVAKMGIFKVVPK
jgi:hypothetical protein